MHHSHGERLKNALEFCVDAAVLIPDYHFYSTEAFFPRGGGEGLISEHLCSGKAVVLHLLQRCRPHEAAILSVTHQNIPVDLFKADYTR